MKPDAPVIPALLRLGLPTMAVLLLQAGVGVAETWFVSFLGTTALTAAALVFPAYMLMAMMSNGGLGGGVSSAVARALGAGDADRAESLAWHGAVLAVAFGGVFMLAMWVCGGALYRAMGARDDALSAALVYSHIVFAGSILVWLVALLGAALRGAGQVRVPARITLVGAIALLGLSPLLIFGVGPLPGLGIAGAGLALCAYFLFATIALVTYMRTPKSPVRLTPRRLDWRHVREILGVGTLSAIGTVQSNLTVALVTAAVGHYTSADIAGYGIGSRLDYLLIPLLFGFGTGVVTLVGRSIGAGRPDLALRTAWIGAALAGATTGVIGVVAAVFAPQWAALFTSDAAVVATTTTYLRTVAPFYGLLGVGLTLYFAGQGARRVGWPIAAGTARLAVGGVLAMFAAGTLHWSLAGIFALVAASTALFGLVIAGALVVKPWTRAVVPGVLVPIPKASPS
jgi:putative MATE family efflux protein